MLRKKMGTLLLAFLSLFGVGLGTVATASPAAAATQVCRNVDYVTNSTWLRICLTYDGNFTSYRPRELLAWNPPGGGTTGSIGTNLTLWQPNPFSAVTKPCGNIADGNTCVHNLGSAVGYMPGAYFQCAQFRNPSGANAVLNIRPNGSQVINNTNCNEQLGIQGASGSGVPSTISSSEGELVKTGAAGS